MTTWKCPKCGSRAMRLSEEDERIVCFNDDCDFCLELSDGVTPTWLLMFPSMMFSIVGYTGRQAFVSKEEETPDRFILRVLKNSKEIQGDAVLDYMLKDLGIKTEPVDLSKIKLKEEKVCQKKRK